MRKPKSATGQGRTLLAGVSPVLAAMLTLLPVGRSLAEELPQNRIAYSVEPYETVPGTLFICGGGKLPEAALQRFVDLAGGPRAHLAVITTASETADSPEVESRIEFWRRFRLSELTVLHTRSRETANDPAFIQPLERATGVWFIGGHQDRLTSAYLGTGVQKAIHRVLARGGVVGGTSAGAAIMSPVMIKGGNPKAEVTEGFGLLPGTVVDQHFIKRRREERLLSVLTEFPDLVGFGIDEGTALIVQGRRLLVAGESESRVITCLAPVGDRPAQTITLEPGTEADLVALRRTAASRNKPALRFTAAAQESPVRKGTLILVGGGETPLEATKRFIEAAGGPDAPLVVVTTAAGDLAPPEAEATSWLTAAGARHVRQVHARTRHEAESAQVLEVLKGASGVWFTGGRQWRLVDAFLDTLAEQVMHDLLARGGAIGGSAAGASIQAAYLVRGSPLTNNQIMAEGYEEGFGFLPGIAVDPYFTQRNRFDDMKQLKSAHPHLVGLGLDEGTAIVVHGSEMEVVGKHQVSVYDRQESADDTQPRFDLLYAGDRYDLTGRKRMGPERSATTVEVANSSESAAPMTADSAAAEEPAESAEPAAEAPRPQPALVCE